ncbi:MAG: baseplate wedge protein 53 [Kordiimonadaceae bacterium]|jgi:hypothetical protein|nr:baseplate wedge protein 53 [Kordiimonadaceae bacterium]
MFNYIPNLKKQELVSGTESTYNKVDSVYINYDNIPRKVKNLFIKVKVPQSYIDNPYTWELWYVRDQDSPEIIAEKYYGDSNYYWIILLFNNMINRYDDWPLNERSFNKKIIRDYGSLRYSMIIPHCYVKLTSRDVIDEYNNIETIIDEDYKISPTTYEKLSFNERNSFKLITKYDYELSNNEERRNIRILKQNIIPDFLSEFKRMVEL